MIRYLGVLDGANLATGNVREREHIILLESLDGGRPLPIPGGLGDDAQLTLWVLPIVSPLTNDADVMRWATTEERTERAWQSIADDPDPYPDYILTLGPRGGVRTEWA
jgi:hypothetical protein